VRKKKLAGILIFLPRGGTFFSKDIKIKHHNYRFGANLFPAGDAEIDDNAPWEQHGSIFFSGLS